MEIDLLTPVFHLPSQACLAAHCTNLQQVLKIVKFGEIAFYQAQRSEKVFDKLTFVNIELVMYEI
jgi:hypothetical protein